MSASVARPGAADEHVRVADALTRPREPASRSRAHARPIPDDVERWLADLRVEPVDRGEREGVHSWDVVLDGRRRRRLRITLILAPDLGLVAWAHYAPPLNDSFRKSYRSLLHWNDETPFAKFALGDDERIVLSAEVPPAALDREALGETLGRLLSIADDRLDASRDWLWPGGRQPAGEPPAEPWPLLDRYAPADAAGTEDVAR